MSGSHRRTLLAVLVIGMSVPVVASAQSAGGGPTSAAPAIVPAPLAGVQIALGQAPVGRDPVAARALALDDAFRQAVEEVAAGMLTPAELAAADLPRRILPRAGDYVQSYRLLAESEEQGVLQVRIEASLDRTRLARDLAPRSSAGPASAPSGVPIAAQVIDQVQAPASAPARLVEGVGDAGFASLARALAAVGFSARPVTGDGDEALFLSRARALGAPLALSLIVTAGDLARIRGTDLWGAVGTVTARLLDVGGSSAPDELQAPIAGYGPTGASSIARARAVAGSLVPRALAGALAAHAVPLTPAGLHVEASGIARWRDLHAFEQILADIPGVGSVVPARFTPGQAELFVRTARTEEDVRGALARASSQEIQLFVGAIDPARPGTIAVRVLPTPTVQESVAPAAPELP